MRARAVTLVLVIILSLLGAVGTATPVGEPTAPAQNSASTHQVANNSSLGGQLSSFMQSTSGTTSESVDRRMYNAAFENASNQTERAAVVRDRVATLRNRIERIRDQQELLQTARNNGSISAAEFRARMSRLVGKLTALNRSLEELANQAESVGVNRTAVETLRQQAANAASPALAAFAQEMFGNQSELPGPANGTEPGAPAEPGNESDETPPVTGNETNNESNQRNDDRQNERGNQTGNCGNGESTEDCERSTAERRTGEFG